MNALLHRLHAENESRVLPPGTVLLNLREYIRSIPILLRGHVKVVGEDDDGNEILLYHLKEGDSCVMSVLGALNGTASKVRAVTLDETEVVFIRPERAAQLVKESPEWSTFIFELYQTRFEELLEAVTRVNFKKLDDRIFTLLREKSQLLDTKILEMTHQDIALSIGSSREVVSRVLKKLEQSGKIALHRGKIRLL
jgi:CRP/FNR family transcriptional regulator, anaerobic regulatory protein